MVAILIPKWAALHHACSTVLLVAGGRVSGEIELAKICEVMLAPFVVDKHSTLGSGIGTEVVS